MNWKKYWFSIISLPAIFLLIFVTLYVLGDRVIFRGHAAEGKPTTLDIFERTARSRENSSSGLHVERNESLGFELSFNENIWQEEKINNGFKLITKTGQGEGSFELRVLPSAGGNTSTHKVLEETYLGQKSTFEEYLFARKERSYLVTLRFDDLSGIRAEEEKVLQSLVFSDNASWQVQGVSDENFKNIEQMVEQVRPVVVGVLHFNCRKVGFQHKTYDFCGSSKGTGFIVSSTGDVVTNAHVAAPSPEQLLVEELTLPHSGGLLREILRSKGSSNVEEVRANPTVYNSVVRYIFQLIETGELKTWFEKESVLVRLSNSPFSKENESSGEVSGSEERTIVKASVVSAHSPNRYSPEVVLHGQPQDGEDLAILKVESGFSSFPTVKVSSGEGLKEGSPLIVIGYPLSVEGGQNPDSLLLYQASSVRPTVSRGIVSAIKSDSQGRRLVQTDASIEQGNSGGPAFNLGGEVIGVVTFGVKSELGNFNFLRDSADVAKLLSQNYVSNGNSEVARLWQQGLIDFDDGFYSRSLPSFNKVKELYPPHPTVDLYLSDAREAIASGKDSGQVLGMEKKFIFAGSVSVVFTGVFGGLIEWWRRRRRQYEEYSI